ncbi:Peptidase C13 family [Methanoregula formicica SMSP]|uniref:Peptidase C13 family n=2 Tax=Methanoregula formicica TaxID=882104 RepID=L0HC62_METFS|nr:Peptidase C13 family [Methanoregula formicica SMSP]
MEKYALLVSGGVNASSNYGRYLNDLMEIYKTLVTKCGYPKANITVLYADGSPHDLDGDGASEISASATKANLLNAFTTMKTKVTANDLFFFYSTNHGGQVTTGTNKAKLWLWNAEFIQDTEFAVCLDAMSYKLAILTMEQCYSGGFLDNLQGANRVIATACRWDQVSWACDSHGNYDEFVYHWTAAVRGQQPDGTVVDASGGDGKVTLKEAFDYAKANDSTAEEPQYYENPAGIGSQYTLCGPLTIIDTCGSYARHLCLVRDGSICTPISRIIRCIPLSRIIPDCIPLIRHTCTPLSRFLCTPISRLIGPGCPSRIIAPICQPLSKIIPEFTETATCTAKQFVQPPCGRHVRLPDDMTVRIRPEELVMTQYNEVKSSYIQTIQDMMSSGYSNDEVADTLENLAVQLQEDLADILNSAQQLRASNRHFSRLTR